jgi:DNA-binding transcriptional regulator YiaG
MRMEIGTPPEAVLELLERLDNQRVQLLQETANAVKSLATAESWKWAIKAVTKSGLSQADIARGLDVTRSTVMRWEKGETTPPAASIPVLRSHLLKLLK